MKCLPLSILLLSLTTLFASAQDRKVFRISPGRSILETVPADEANSYADFRDGTVYFLDGNFSTAKLNCSYLLGEMRFINAKGDTLSLADEYRIKAISIGTDTFYYDKVYVKALANYGSSKLAVRQFFSFLNRQKIGGFGELSSASIDTYDVLTVANTSPSAIVAREELSIAKYKVYYIGDKFNHFLPASKRSIMEIYPKKTKEIKEYLKRNSVNFFNEEDIRKLMIALMN